MTEKSENAESAAVEQTKEPEGQPAKILSVEHREAGEAIARAAVARAGVGDRAIELAKKIARQKILQLGLPAWAVDMLIEFVFELIEKLMDAKK